MSKKRKIYKLIFIASVFLLIISFLFIFMYYTSPQRVYESNWKINLPSDMQQLYDIKSPTGPNGDGYEFTIYRIKGDKFPILSDANSQKENFIESQVISILDELNTDRNQYPNFSHQYKWKVLTSYSNTLYIIYDSELSLVYIVQSMK